MNRLCTTPRTGMSPKWRPPSAMVPATPVQRLSSNAFRTRAGRGRAEGALSAGFHTDRQPVEMVHYDAIILGTPTRFGNMASQMKNFLDRAGGLWAADKLVGNVGSVFTSTESQHGGQESTILATHIVLLHLRMIVVGLPYTFKGQLRTDEVTGGSPYGASTLAGDGSRFPTDNELAGARLQGRHVADTAAALVLGRTHAQPLGPG
jgi:NAD(P)H dehydrogenase (quinone)